MEDPCSRVMTACRVRANKLVGPRALSTHCEVVETASTVDVPSLHSAVRCVAVFGSGSGLGDSTLDTCAREYVNALTRVSVSAPHMS